MRAFVQLFVFSAFALHTISRQYNMSVYCFPCPSSSYCIARNQTCMQYNGGPFNHQFQGCQIPSNCVDQLPVTKRIYECSKCSTTCCSDTYFHEKSQSIGTCIPPQYASPFCRFEGLTSTEYVLIIGGIIAAAVIVILIICCCKKSAKNEESGYQKLSR